MKLQDENKAASQPPFTSLTEGLKKMVGVAQGTSKNWYLGSLGWTRYVSRNILAFEWWICK